MCLSLNSWNSNLALPETVSGSSVLRRGANVPSCQGSMDWQMDQERWDFSLKILDKGLLLGNIVTWLSNLELTQWEGFALQLTTQIFITSSHCMHARTHRHTHTLYIARATVAKSHRLNNTDVSFTVLEAEVHDQGVCRVGLSWGLSPWLANGCLLSMSSHGLSSVVSIPGVSLCVLMPSYKGTSHMGLEPILMVAF